MIDVTGARGLGIVLLATIVIACGHGVSGVDAPLASDAPVMVDCLGSVVQP